MKKRALFTIPISILLIAVIVTSFFLMNIKPDTSNISQAKKLAEYSKPAVVRVYDYAVVDWQFFDYFPEIEAILAEMNYRTFVGGYGSGAIISHNGYIVTNAHVVSTTQMSDEDILQEALISLTLTIADELQVDAEAVYFYLLETLGYKNLSRKTEVVLPGGDILDGEIKSYGSPIGEKDGDWKDVAVLKIEAKNLPTLKLGNSDDVEDQEEIWAIGYPSLAEYNVLSIDSSLESTMNSGEISATSKKLETGTSVIQLNAATSTGNSGGPIINDKGEIVGLLTFGAEVTGFDFAIPVNTVKEFVNQAGAKNKGSETDRLFKEGLELFWGGYYKEALEKFESVERLYPKHSLVKKYIQDSEEKIDESKILWSSYSTIFYIVDGVAVLIIIFLMLYTFVFGKKEPKVMAITSGGPAPALDPTPSQATIPEATPNSKQTPRANASPNANTNTSAPPSPPQATSSEPTEEKPDE